MLRKVLLFFAALCIAIALAVSIHFWQEEVAFQSKVNAPKVLEFSKISTPYTFNYPYEQQILDEPFKKLIAPHCKEVDIGEIVAKCEDHLIELYPHLEEALLDTSGTPLLPDDYKPKDEEEIRVRFIVQLYMDDYEKHTLDSPDKVLSLKEVLALALDDIFVKKSTSTTPPYLAELKTSNDPLVKFALSHFETDAEDPYRVVLEAYQAIKTRDCHPFLVMSISRSALNWKNGRETEREAIFETYIDSILTQLRNPETPAETMSNVAYGILVLPQQVMAPGMLKFCREILDPKKPPCPKWAIHVALGGLFKRIASYHRGTAFMSSVSEENVQLFDMYSKSAIEQFVQAWEIRPESFGIIKELSDLEGWHGGTTRSLDEWLRYLVAINPSDSRSYSSFCHFSVPRWGGSYERLGWLAEKLSETIRVTKDAKVAGLFWLPINKIVQDSEMEAPLQNRGLLVAMMNIGREAKKDPSILRKSCTSGEFYAACCCILWDADRYKELKWFIENYEDLCNPNCIAFFDRDLRLMKAVSQASNDRNRHIWAQIVLQLFRHSEDITEDKLPDLSAMLEEANSLADQPGGEGYRIAHTALETLKTFHRGEPAEIQFDPELLAWQTSLPLKVTSERTAELEYNVFRTDLTLAPRLRFKPPYRLTTTLRNIEDANDEYGFALQIGNDPLETAFHFTSAIHVTPSSNMLRVHSTHSDDGMPLVNAYQLKSSFETLPIGFDVREDDIDTLIGEEQVIDMLTTRPPEGPIRFRRWTTNTNAHDKRPRTGKFEFGSLWIEKPPYSKERPLYKWLREHPEKNPEPPKDSSDSTPNSKVDESDSNKEIPVNNT